MHIRYVVVLAGAFLVGAGVFLLVSGGVQTFHPGFSERDCTPERTQEEPPEGGAAGNGTAEDKGAPADCILRPPPSAVTRFALGIGLLLALLATALLWRGAL